MAYWFLVRDLKWLPLWRRLRLWGWLAGRLCLLRLLRLLHGCVWL